MLAFASEAWAIDEQDWNALVAEGLVPERVGAELEPTRYYVFAPRERALRIASRRALPMRLGPELLAASRVVLVAFDAAPRAPPASSATR